MKFKFPIVILSMILLASSALSQSGTFSGLVIDSASKKPLNKVIITVVSPSDSMLVTFTRTDSAGMFQLRKLKAGRYRMILTKTGFADYEDVVDINFHNGPLKFSMLLKAKLLENITIRNKINAIVIKGDTIEYKADSFKVGTNASAQELLQRLPGISIDGRGRITVYGNRVSKVLVDGDEFFGDDPGLVIQNIKAGMIDKVIVFDKKSESATLTGVDDGKRQKTINLQLKDDARFRHFGKLEAGVSVEGEGYKEGKAMMNMFNGKKKAAAYVTFDNTKYESMDSKDRNSFAGSSSDDEEQDLSDGEENLASVSGIPQSVSSGGTFLTKWDNEKKKTNSTFQYNRLDLSGRSILNQKIIFGDSTISQYSTQQFNTLKNKIRLNSIFETSLDSNSTFKISGRTLRTDNLSNAVYTSKILTDDNELVNTGTRSITNKTENYATNAAVSYKRKLRRRGELISLKFEYLNIHRKGDGNYMSDYNLFDRQGALQKLEHFDQFKSLKESTISFGSRLAYSRMVFKNSFLETYFTLNSSNNASSNGTYERPIQGDKYSLLIDSLSNRFNYTIRSCATGISYKYSTKKIIAAITSGFSITQYQLDNIDKLNSNARRFTNILPSASFIFLPKKQQRVQISYNGFARNPGIQQIQPYKDNSDPVAVKTGNQNIGQEFYHIFNFSGSDYQVKHSRYIAINAVVSLVKNAIVNNFYIDNYGKTRQQYENLNGNYSANLSFSFSRQAWNTLYLYVNVGPVLSRGVMLINDELVYNENRNLQVTGSISSVKAGLFSYGLSSSVQRSHASYSVAKSAPINYWQYRSQPNITFRFKKAKTSIDIRGDFTFFFRHE